MQSDWSTGNQLVQKFGFLFVDNRNEPFELCPDFERIQITFDESDVGFDCWTNVFNPVFLRLFVFLHISCFEMSNVLSDHVLLNFIGSVLFCFSQIIVYWLQKGSKLAVLNNHFQSVLLNDLLPLLDWGHFDDELVFVDFD